MELSKQNNEIDKNLQGHTVLFQCLFYINYFKSIRPQNQMLEINGLSCMDQFITLLLTYKQCKIYTISGNDDKSIKVWQVGFNKNISAYKHSLDQYDIYVMPLSLNQSETQLVSCAYNKYEIIILERREWDKFEFKNFVRMDEIYYTNKVISHFIYTQSIQEEGLKINIKENQFNWIASMKKLINSMYLNLKKEKDIQ
ncbi:unnamed protein product [Paramecium pentaurelia]|uniref:Uncharacterized protein n=1 Tax=Paramecium pentaurelia TaxID=43138 RepID=A0A8S1U9C8_9CILI|nr:unnamed protein product [Paramecium pentaurelia]